MFSPAKPGLFAPNAKALESKLRESKDMQLGPAFWWREMQVGEIRRAPPGMVLKPYKL